MRRRPRDAASRRISPVVSANAVPPNRRQIDITDFGLAQPVSTMLECEYFGRSSMRSLSSYRLLRLPAARPPHVISRILALVSFLALLLAACAPTASHA